MQHLTLEEIARLVDEAATPAEGQHLDRCGDCTARLAAMKTQTAALRTLPDPIPPASHRMQLESAWVAEAHLAERRARVAGRYRLAAGIALFLFGGATGALFVAPALEPPPEGTGAIGRVGATRAPEDVRQAAQELAEAEAEYLRRLAVFAQMTFSPDGVDPLNRLAALEGIVLTTRAALRESPADPVINNYHLTAVGQRDALLRQIQEATPEGGGDEWF